MVSGVMALGAADRPRLVLCVVPLFKLIFNLLFLSFCVVRTVARASNIFTIVCSLQHLHYHCHHAAIVLILFS